MIEVAEIVLHEADEPYSVAALLNADLLDAEDAAKEVSWRSQRIILSSGDPSSLLSKRPLRPASVGVGYCSPVIHPVQQFTR